MFVFHRKFFNSVAPLRAFTPKRNEYIYNFKSTKRIEKDVCNGGVTLCNGVWWNRGAIETNDDTLPATRRLIRWIGDAGGIFMRILLTVRRMNAVSARPPSITVRGRFKRFCHFQHSRYGPNYRLMLRRVSERDRGFVNRYRTFKILTQCAFINFLPD